MDTATHRLPTIARKALLMSSVALCAAAGASVAGVPAPAGAQSPLLQIAEGFDDVATLPSAGWLQQNNSEPRGVTDWYQGLPAQFSSHDGELGSYIAANLNNTAGRGRISNWLVTPLLEFDSGAVASFFTRSAGGYYVDRMQVRLCTGTDCSDVGTSADDVGDFTTLLLDINPDYEYQGYPTTWEQQILDDLPTSGTGRIAFRYFVESGGSAGDNSNYIGIDRFAYDSGAGATPVPSAGLSFTPGTINAGHASTLKITLQNPADDEAVLASAFTHALPAGMVLATDANEGTTCGSGTITTTSTAVTLASGATIPGKGACSIQVDVTASAEGDYVNTINAGALATDQGDNVNAASATLEVLEALGPPSASVDVTALSFTVPETSTASTIFTITNAANTEPLDYSIDARDQADAGAVPLTAGRNYSTQDARDVGNKKPLAPRGDASTRSIAGNVLSGNALGGDVVVRATGSTGGAVCTGPIVSWMTATPASGTVEAEDSAYIYVAVNPLAANLAIGSHSADLCITTNDPVQPVIQIPVNLTVTEAEAPPVDEGGCGGEDSIFCDGFDGEVEEGPIVRRVINQVVPHTADGGALNLATGAFHPYDPDETGDDINLYNGDPAGSMLVVYWFADLVPPEFTAMVGGVVDMVGQDYDVLQSGDTVGPDSVIKAGNRPLYNWFNDTDGYLGIAFYNEETGMVNYGYIHIVTTSPDGFPVNVLEYAYDRTGAAITIP